MMKSQLDHDNMAALLELMLATNDVADPHTLTEQVLDWLMARDGVASAGVWLAQPRELVCLARRNLDLDDLVPTVQQLLEMPVPTPQTSVYQQDLRLTLLPLGRAADQRGALAVVTQAPPDPGELLLLQAVAAHLAGTLTRPQPSELSDRVWEEFLAHAAHEIKNPLASIKGYADLLLRRAAKDPADPYRKGLITIAQQVSRTTSLLDQLSDITRISSGPLPLDRHESDFATIVAQVVQDCQATDQQHTITFDRDAMALPGRFDQVRLAQVVGAVLNNALKFSVDGGAVRVLLRRAVVDAGVAQARLDISDTGIGVPEGEQERVFERFFRGSNVRGTYAGLGVGLYIARAVIDQHGGQIWLESERGAGTTCHVALPLVA